MSSNALYTDLSAYYDLMCADINYAGQSDYVRRLHQLFGNNGKRYLDLACGTGPHVRHFVDFGYQCSGLDIHQPMLDIAARRCPEAQFMQHDMATFTVAEPFDLVSCFLYSIHYNDGIEKLQACIGRVHEALGSGGMWVFTAVDKNTITNNDCACHAMQHGDSRFLFQSGWQYEGTGDKQALLVRIEKESAGRTDVWQDRHAMVAVGFRQLAEMLEPAFDVHVFEHDFDKIVPWNGVSGNAVFTAIKK